MYIGSPWRPWYGPGWYPGWGWSAYPPVVVAPPVVVSPPPNVVYVERAPEPVDPGAAPAAGYWYWCAEPQGWYPEVRECTNGWQPVPPRAQAQ
ncbi:MAG TPA: hypothetical protein VEA81_07820 [Burkholderiaceae bacterium]|nr:hypothetical protein [Burkholderiaceae bacterium]